MHFIHRSLRSLRASSHCKLFEKRKGTGRRVEVRPDRQPSWSPLAHRKLRPVQCILRRTVAQVERSTGPSHWARLSVDANLRRLRPSAIFQPGSALCGGLRGCRARHVLYRLRPAHAGNWKSPGGRFIPGMRTGGEGVAGRHAGCALPPAGSASRFARSSTGRCRH